MSSKFKNRPFVITFINLMILLIASLVGYLVINRSQVPGAQPVVAPATSTTAATITATATQSIPSATAIDQAAYTSPPVMASQAPILDPLTIPKYVEALTIPPVMPSEGQSDWNGLGQMETEYWIVARQFSQQVLPKGFPESIVWGYGR